MSEPCECSGAGWCDRHKMKKTANQVSNCRARSDYREMWDRKAPTLMQLPPPLEVQLQQQASNRTAVFRSARIGDMLAAATKFLGIGPCAGCHGRAVALNRYLSVPTFGLVNPQPLVETTWVDWPERPADWGAPTPDWAVGVTTAYRAEPALMKSLVSLCKAGFTDVHVFAERGSTLPKDTPGIDACDHVRGVMPNWLHALRTLVTERPSAKYYFIAQDDVWYSKNLRMFLERDLWFANDIGFVSPYHSSGKTLPNRSAGAARYRPRRFYPAEEYIHRTEGYRRLAKPGAALWGALTYIFPWESVQILLNDSWLARQERTIDLNIPPVLARADRRAYYYFPSLAQHIRGPSSINHGNGDSKCGMGAADWPGEDFDCVSLLEKAP